MPNLQPKRLNSISEYHKFRALPKPEHPLVSVINFDAMQQLPVLASQSIVFDYYSIALKRNFSANVKYKYGQRDYDFDEGTMFFMAPGQVFSIETSGEYKVSGWMLLVHPDFFWNTLLAKKIKQYDFFSYAVHEALHLSDKEENMLTAIMHQIEHEYHSNIDAFSQDVIIAQIELLLTYAQRFYQRQFLTRKKTNHKILEQLEILLNGYLNGDSSTQNGLPTVQFIAEKLNVSPNYLSGLLKVLTGQSTQQHIQEKLIEKAKEKLSATNLSVSEIAYALGFGHPQSFSKLFKLKTNLSPLEFRQSFS